jgi:calcineurin-like phosphoesterase family protein
MKYWFTSDEHFDHEMVITYAKRPFLTNGKPDVELMNEELIRRSNALVQPDDHLYILGDVSMGVPGRAYDHISRLNGKKFWVPGNHDRKTRENSRVRSLFEWIKDLAEIRVPDETITEGRNRGTQPIVLCHYAMRTWNKSHFGAWQLFGHSHGTLHDNPNALQLDVGVDCWDYAPVSYEQIKERMAKKTWQPIDHHDPATRPQET